jgi:HSP20 family molecular chaperone IbpA
MMHSDRKMLSPFFAWDLFDEPADRRPQWSMLNNFSPLVDIKETPEAITLRCEMPGIPPESVQLDFNDGCITISGNKIGPQESDRFSQLGQQGQFQQHPSHQGQPLQQQQPGQHQQQQTQPGLQGQFREGQQGTQQQPLQQAQQQGQFQQQPYHQGQPLQQQQQGQHQQQQTQPGLQGQVREGQQGTQQQQGLFREGQQQGLQQVGMETQQQGREQQRPGMGMQRKESEKAQWHRIESSCGEFRRSFRLPRGVNAKNITANSKYGVLEIVVAKPSELQKDTGERINISSAST